MGKVRIIPNISYASDNLGKLSGINVNIPSGKAIIIRNASFISNNLGQVEFLGNEVGDELKITSAGNITISFPNNLEYKYDANVWDNWKTYTANETLQIAPGKSIIFRGDLTPNENTGIGTFVISGDCNVSGNPLSLINYGNISSYAFKYLFKDCTYLLNAEDLILPNTTAISCYEGMFKNCSSLETAPMLPATTLTSNCYKELFYNCESLNYIEIKSTTLLGENYSLNWVYNVASEGEFKQPTNISNEFGVNAIPTNWITKIDYSQMYFTIESLQDNNTISLVKGKSCSINPVLYYSVDDGQNWSTVTGSSSTNNITTINTGDKLIIKSMNNSLATVWDTYNRFNGSKNFKVYGNVMSLLYGDNFVNNSEFATGTTHNLAGLFYGTTTLIDASNLILPATTCVESCYNGMFRDTTNLANGPAILPATISAHDCYSSMFEGCINLEKAPEINLTVASENCCKRMFCMSRTTKLTTPKLTKGPVLKITTLLNTCYEEMFRGNGNLVEVTCLATAGMSGNCNNWLANCSTGTFYKSPSASWNSGTGAIPSGWTTQDYVESNS